MSDIKIGERVRATMNGQDWFTGKYVQESDIFAQYGVLRDDIKEIRFFVHAEPHSHCICDACKGGVIHNSECAVHNMPSFENGACDCGAKEQL
jgi:hypothetical protein